MDVYRTAIKYYSLQFTNQIKSQSKKVWTISIGVILVFLFFFGQPMSYFYQNHVFNLKSMTKLSINTTTSVPVSVIPPVIHYIYLKGEKGMILAAYRPYIENCIEINKDVKFVLWTKENMNLLLKTLATKEMQLHMKENNRRLIHRSDIFRYIVIYYFGGIYMDLDTICVRPIYKQIRNDSFVLAIEPPIHTRIELDLEKVIANNFFASPPRHPFMKYLLDNLNKNPQVSDSVLHTTGPLYVNSLYLKFIAKHNFTEIPIRVLNSTKYFPEINIEYHRKLCKSKKVPACDELDSYSFWLESKGFKEAVLIHKGLSYGWKETKGPNFNVSQIFPDLKSWP